MDVNSVTQAVSNNSSLAANAAQETSKISSDFETFLKMLTVQLENQDPLEPIKSEDFAVQLATFSGVEQQVLTNDLLKSLQSQMSISGMAQFAGWVGMEARAPVAAHFDGAPITLAPEPDLTSNSANLVVKNEFGTEVQRVPINVSHDPIEWSGLIGSNLASSGLYTFSVESVSAGAVTSTKPVEVYTQIIEARTSNGETVLVTEGGVEVATDAVTALRDPATAS